MKIVILEPIGLTSEDISKIIKSFESLDHELITYENRPTNDDEIIKRAEEANILILSNLPLSENVIKCCTNLQFISVAFAGVDHIPMELCRTKNIIVSNTAGYSNHSVAELVIGSAISLLRKIVWSNTQTRKLSTREGFLGTELHEKTFGIIGLGQIGKEVAHLANAFGCRVLAYSRTPKDIENIEFSNLDYLLKESDIISLHVPLTEETQDLINKKKLQLLKPQAIIINTARGPVINYHALSEALINHNISGAAIDVYEKEPPLEKNHPLFNAPNLILLPHIGYATHEAIKLRGDIVIENIHKWLAGNPQNIMN